MAAVVKEYAAKAEGYSRHKPTCVHPNPNFKHLPEWPHRPAKALQAEMEAKVAAYDVDGDGTLDFLEFITMVADNLALFNMTPDPASQTEIEERVAALKQNKAVVDEKWAKMQVLGATSVLCVSTCRPSKTGCDADRYTSVGNLSQAR